MIAELIVVLILIALVGSFVSSPAKTASKAREFRYSSSWGDNYKFELVPSGREVRIYISEAPGYGQLATDGHSTHRHFDETRSQHWVCVDKDLGPSNEHEAREWAKYWADKTSTYIRTGRAFS